MPFTLAHPAAVLWLGRGQLSLLALVSGALAPDLPYFLRATPLPVTADSWYEPYVNATAAHSWGELFPVALPLAVVVWLGGCLVLPPLRWVTGMEPGLPTPTLRGSVWVLVSLIVGVLTHLGWDWLTEQGGSASRLLQHGSTVLGLVVLAVFVLRRRTIVRWRDENVRRKLLGSTALVALGAIAGALAVTWSWLDPEPGLGATEVVEGVLADAVTGGTAGAVFAAVLLSLGWWVSGAGRTPAPPS